MKSLHCDRIYPDPPLGSLWPTKTKPFIKHTYIHARVGDKLFRKRQLNRERWYYNLSIVIASTQAILNAAAGRHTYIHTLVGDSGSPTRLLSGVHGMMQSIHWDRIFPGIVLSSPDRLTQALAYILTLIGVEAFPDNCNGGQGSMRSFNSDRIYPCPSIRQTLTG